MPDFDPNRDLGRDDIPVPFAESAITDGVHATFDDHGRLLRLVTLRGGLVNGHDIIVDPDRGTASHAQVKVHADAGDDGGTALRSFVAEAVDELTRSLTESPVHCAFCLKTRRQVGAMLAGQRCCICDECVKVCSEALAGD